MANETGKYSRRNYFVHKGFQVKFSLIVFITAFVIGIIAIWTTYITTWNEVTTQVQSKQLYERIKTVYDKKQIEEDGAGMINALVVVEFSEIFDRVAGVLVLRLLVGSFFLFLLSIFVSHKIAGPIYRMENAAQAIGNGDLSVDLSKLRNGDELAELARSIDGAVKKLRGLMERYKEMALKLSELTGKISSYQEGGQSASSESQQLIKELEVVSTQLVTEINYFKTPKKKSSSQTGKDDITHY